MTSPRETVLCQYHYDPLDRLISHTLTDTLERQRFYCKSRLATEMQGVMRYSIVQHGEQLLAQQRSEGDAPETTLLSTDQQRSVLQTRKAKHPPQPIAYSPYGYRPVEGGLPSLLGFNGERPDPVTGCYLLGNGYRAFNPALMRFNSPDGLSPFGKGGLNPYAYCSGDPMNFTDASGQSRWKLLSWIRKKFSKTTTNGNTSKHANKFAKPLSEQHEFFGYHGSTSEHVASLENGLDPSFIGSNRGTGHGLGFYVTKNRETAQAVAKEATRNKNDVTPVIFDVYLKRSTSSNWVDGIKEAGDKEHFVISTTRYEDVVLKASDIRSGSQNPNQQ
ncbi:RHS repeat-associated core domain-containing protein [Pseudomonas silesiensis]|jgi:RHS repeat-associated protein|uniref:RHS repeat-associated core domain-containing protein n=1 Tax=Pseudomonas silesiensis TaxID=1853130 RepID=UPI0009EDD936|nr:RHS repeat-associated core domain-containing protein [Pseudomonas silesiensis]VVO51611.1 hypothetical protein PS874_00190 [Pseudomonas fluorescens]